ncbi:hypothetical protein EV426DRAFT_713738 [Tirmania nivea]|nr:hypothetical protein EV426DRAFT_713738 [Tirmania nivea]
MKFPIFAAAVALAVPAVCTQIEGLPDCAHSCIASGLPLSGCTLTDFKCVCASEPFLQYAATCFSSSCAMNQIEPAIAAAFLFCQSFGIKIPTPLPEVTRMPTKVPEMTRAPTSPPVVTTETPVETTETPVETTETSVETTETPVETTKAPVVSETTTLFTEVPYPVTTLTTDTLYGTGSMTQTRNITSPTVVPPPSNSDSAAVKNVAGLGAMAMAVAGFFVL